MKENGTQQKLDDDNHKLSISQFFNLMENLSEVKLKS